MQMTNRSRLRRHWSGRPQGREGDLTGTHKAGEHVGGRPQNRVACFGTRGKGNIGAPVMQDGKIVDEPFKTSSTLRIIGAS